MPRVRLDSLLLVDHLSHLSRSLCGTCWLIFGVHTIRHKADNPASSDPVTDLPLLKQVVLTFSILSFNKYDKSRIKVIGVENGIVALIESLICLTRCADAPF